MPVELESYQPGWATAFEQLKTALLQLLSDLPIDIQHVGSTAIPGMLAKPFLDIDIVIEKKEWLKTITSRLVSAGYHHRGDQGIPGRFAFRQSGPDTPQLIPRQHWQAHHLYVCYADSLALKNHLLFRDALLNNSSLAAEYSRLKKTLTEALSLNRELYTKTKSDFVLAVLAAAGMSTDELDTIKSANQ